MKRPSNPSMLSLSQKISFWRKWISQSFGNARDKGEKVTDLRERGGERIAIDRGRSWALFGFSLTFSRRRAEYVSKYVRARGRLQKHPNLLGFSRIFPNTRMAGANPAIFLLSSAGTPRFVGNLGGAPAAKTCKPLTSRTPVNIGVRGPRYEMEGYAHRGSRLKSSLLRL